MLVFWEDSFPSCPIGEPVPFCTELLDASLNNALHERDFYMV